MTEWAPLCMDETEWEDWRRLNPRLNAMTYASRPCTDCPKTFARQMRAVSKCNGMPGGVEDQVDEPIVVKPKPVAPPVQVETELDAATRASLLFLTKVFKGEAEPAAKEDRALLAAATSIVSSWSRHQATKADRERNAIVRANLSMPKELDSGDERRTA